MIKKTLLSCALILLAGIAFSRDEANMQKAQINYQQGIRMRVWVGWLDPQNWSSNTFNERKCVGGMINRGNLIYKNQRGQAKSDPPVAIEVFNPLAILASSHLKPYANGAMTVCYQGELKISTSGEHTFSIIHPTIPRGWSCGNYAMYLNDVEVIKVAAKGYNLKNNEIQSASVDLEPGYYSFCVINQLNWACPAASNLRIAMKAPGSDESRPLTAKDFWVPVRRTAK